MPTRSQPRPGRLWRAVTIGRRALTAASSSTTRSCSDRANTSFDPGSCRPSTRSQVTNALFDGLTDFDFTDKCAAGAQGPVAEKWESNADATEFTFKIKEGLKFSNGEPVLPSSFKIAWERNGSKELASPYGYLINYVKGGADLQEGTVDDPRLDRRR